MKNIRKRLFGRDRKEPRGLRAWLSFDIIMNNVYNICSTPLERGGAKVIYFGNLLECELVFTMSLWIVRRIRGGGGGVRSGPTHPDQIHTRASLQVYHYYVYNICISLASGVGCYNCSSEHDPLCGDPFWGGSHYLINCPSSCLKVKRSSTYGRKCKLSQFNEQIPCSCFELKRHFFGCL